MQLFPDAYFIIGHDWHPEAEHAEQLLGQELQVVPDYTEPTGQVKHYELDAPEHVAQLL